MRPNDLSRQLKVGLLVALGTLLGAADEARAGKFSVSTGLFSISAESPTTKGEVTNLGAYQLQYSHTLLPSVELVVGYTVLVSAIVTGDLAYGFDVGGRYFPFTESESIKFSGTNQSVVVTEIWRPFIGAQFSQRQFQAVQTGYAGFGANLGVERPLSESLLLRGEFRYQIFSGTKNATARELDILLGLGFVF